MVQKIVAGVEHFIFEFAKVDDKPFIIEFGGAKAHFKLPGVAMHIDARAAVAANVMGKTDIDAASYSVHELVLASKNGFSNMGCVISRGRSYKLKSLFKSVFYVFR